MSKSFGQKQKLLYLAQYLLRETDEDHPVTAKDLVAYLAAKGIAAERKSLYDDLEQLSVFGLDVIHRPGRGGGYFIGERQFELSEVKLLVDAVQSSRFLTRKKSEELIAKLQQLAGRHEAASLAHHVFVSNRIKTMNESIYLNVDRIRLAIETDRKLRFHYFEWDVDAKRKLRRDGDFYVVSPYFLVWDDENYYLVALDETLRRRHYRVDKMLDLSLADGARDDSEELSRIDPAVYEKKLFGMMGGREERVTLSCDRTYLGVLYDRFGTDLVFRKAGEQLQTSLSVQISPQFYSFIASFGGGIRILSPEWVREDYCKLLREALSPYEEKVK